MEVCQEGYLAGPRFNAGALHDLEHYLHHRARALKHLLPTKCDINIIKLARVLVNYKGDRTTAMQADTRLDSCSIPC